MKSLYETNEDLYHISEQARLKNAFATHESQLYNFNKAINDNNYLLSWQIALGNIYLLDINNINYPSNIEELAGHIGIYYHRNKNVICRRYGVKDSRYFGLYEEFHPNGNLYYRCIYKKHKMEGFYEQWRYDGSLELQCYLKSGRKFGLCKSYHENGKLRSISTYVDDKFQREHEFWSYDGKLIRKNII